MKKARTLKPEGGRFTALSEEKLRGGYYTSPGVASWLCTWAIRHPDDRILEPSCGDGSFLLAAAHRLRELDPQKNFQPAAFSAVEISASEAQKASDSLKLAIGPSAEGVVVNDDFFSWCERNSSELFDVVIGNPPFIRYQSFPEPYRARAMELMQNHGLTPNRLTNIWVPFVVASIGKLAPDGRLALVLPAELLQVTYAGQLRSFLTDRFRRIDVFACNELFFQDAEQEVVLLLAEGGKLQSSRSKACRVAMTEARTIHEITSHSAASFIAKARPKSIYHDSEKWLKYFLSSREIDFMRTLRASNVTKPLSSHASVDVGVVTGKNEFFVLDRGKARELGIEEFTSPLVSRSVHLKGSRIEEAEWHALSDAGDRVHLLDVKATVMSKPTGPLARYIALGEALKVHEGYKCSIRNPWYAVPSIWCPQGFLFRQIYDFPRVVLNQANATSTDTIHRLTVATGSPERVIANTYTWLTAASAEIEGRSYGGGVLELEPTEAERLLMPSALNGALPLEECDRLVRSNRLDLVLEENARVVLMRHMGLSSTDCKMLRTIWQKMRDRRNARRRTSRTPLQTALCLS